MMLADMMVTDWIQAVSAALVAVMTFFLWRLASRQTQLLATSVEVARAAAEAARKSADVAERALIGVQRPLLRIHASRVVERPWPGDAHLFEISATVTIENLGRDPAFIVDAAVQLLPAPRGSGPPIPGVRPFERVWVLNGPDEATMIEPGQANQFQVERLIDARDNQRLTTFDAVHGVLFLYGVIVYDDLLGVRREQGFTFGYLLDEARFSPCVGEGLRYDRIVPPDTNPIMLEPPPGD